MKTLRIAYKLGKRLAYREITHSCTSDGLIGKKIIVEQLEKK